MGYNNKNINWRNRIVALIKCPKCGRDISDKAPKCVGCGWKVEPIKDLKNEQTTKLQHTVITNKEKNFPSANIFLMIALVMICFMIVVWRRLDKFEKEIELLASNIQTESEILIDNTENISDVKPDDILVQDTTENTDADNDVESVSDVTDYEEQKMSNADETKNVSSETEYSSDSIAKIGNLDVDTSEHTRYEAEYYLTDATILEVNEENNTVKVAIKGEVITKATRDRIGVYFKFLDNNGFELCHKFEQISGNVGTFTETYSDIPNTVASVTIK